jgi:hypothetical protein
MSFDEINILNSSSNMQRHRIAIARTVYKNAVKQLDFYL